MLRNGFVGCTAARVVDRTQKRLLRTDRNDKVARPTDVEHLAGSEPPVAVLAPGHRVTTTPSACRAGVDYFELQAAPYRGPPGAASAISFTVSGWNIRFCTVPFESQSDIDDFELERR